MALTEAGKAMDGRKTLDSAGLATILRTGLVAVEATGHATVGDKTLLDALEPAAVASGGRREPKRRPRRGAGQGSDGGRGRF